MMAATPPFERVAGCAAVSGNQLGRQCVEHRTFIHNIVNIVSSGAWASWRAEVQIASVL